MMVKLIMSTFASGWTYHRMWNEIMGEDEAFNYQLKGKGMLQDTPEQLPANTNTDTSMCSDDIALGRCEEVTSDA